MPSTVITKVHSPSKFSYKTSLSSQAPRRGKSGAGSNKNKLLRDENKGFDNNKDDMQLAGHRSSYWTNDNVKRSQQTQQQQQQISSDLGENNLFSPEDNVKDYLDATNDVDVTYLDDDDAVDYDLNGYFNSVNQDNINDFYLYINQLLSKKPTQKI
jgi:hypothetical protein